MRVINLALRRISNVSEHEDASRTQLFPLAQFATHPRRGTSLATGYLGAAHR